MGSTPRSRQLIKESDRIVTSSAILAAESQALTRRVLETKRGVRHVQAAREVIEHIAAVLIKRDGICARCLGRHAGIPHEDVKKHVEAISFHLCITERPGVCLECGRSGILFSFGSGAWDAPSTTR